MIQRVFVAEDAERSGGQEERSTESGFRADPARGQDAEEVAAGDNQYPIIFRPQARDDAVGPGTNVGDAFAIRAAIAENEPAGLAGMNGVRPQPFEVAIIPFSQVGIYLGHRPKAGQFTRSPGTLAWTGEDAREGLAGQSLAHAPGLLFAHGGQWNIRSTGVLPGKRPGGLAVTDEINLG